MSLALKLLRQHWFLVMLLGAVAVGLTFPAPGLWLSAKVGAKPFIFVLLFLTSLSFKTGQLLEGFRSVRAIALSLSGTYILLPALFFLSASLILGLDQPLGVGLIVMGAGPTSLASAAIWTRLSGGNAGLCVALIVISNVLNIVLAPLVLWLLLGEAKVPDPEKVVLGLVLYILIPIALGQIARRLYGEKMAEWAKPLGVASRLILLWIIIQAASRAAVKAGQASLSVGSVLVLLLICVVVHLLAVAAMWSGGKLLKLSRKDRIAVIFVGSQKTLPVAIFLIETYFAQFALGVLSLMVYHATQLILDSLFIEPFKKRVDEEDLQASAS